jgi:SAM-dependent methyltransferase
MFDDVAPHQPNLTGERTAPGVREENYWFQRHVVAYEYVANLVRGKRVLDAGCGEGYGADLLAEAAGEVVGVDLEADVVHRARERYPRVTFDIANLVSLPYPDGSFDAVVSLQVIEHLHTPQEFLSQAKAVLSPGGLLVISTPNRLTFSPEGLRNPFHAFEFSPDELRATLTRQFTGIDMLGTFHALGLTVLERALRKPFPERLLDQPAYEWPRWLQNRVARVTPRDFRIGARRLERSLDLIVLARA